MKKTVVYYNGDENLNEVTLTFDDGNHKEAESNRSDQMIQTLPKILEKVKNRFKFVRLDEMKLIPEEVD